LAPDVGVELTHRLDQSGLFEGGLLAAFVELALKVLDGLQGAVHVAVPEKPFETLQALADLCGKVASRGGLEFIGVRWRCAQALGHGAHHGQAHRDVEPVQEMLGLGVEEAW